MWRQGRNQLKFCGLNGGNLGVKTWIWQEAVVGWAEGPSAKTLRPPPSISTLPNCRHFLLHLIHTCNNNTPRVYCSVGGKICSYPWFISSSHQHYDIGKSGIIISSLHIKTLRLKDTEETAHNKYIISKNICTPALPIPMLIQDSFCYTPYHQTCLF